MDVESFKRTLNGLNNKANTLMIHPFLYKNIQKEYWNMTKWEFFLDGFRNISYILGCYETVDQFPDDFWEALSWGWCCEYIYPYDDPYNPWISSERKLRLGKW